MRAVAEKLKDVISYEIGKPQILSANQARVDLFPYLAPFSGNRSDGLFITEGNINKKRVKDMVKKFKPSALEIITIGVIKTVELQRRYSNPKYFSRRLPNGDLLVICDGHHRTEAIKMVQRDDFEVVFNFIHESEFMEVYMIKDNRRKHSPHEVYTSPGISIGRECIAIAKEIGLPCRIEPHLFHRMIATFHSYFSYPNRTRIDHVTLANLVGTDGKWREFMKKELSDTVFDNRTEKLSILLDSFEIPVYIPDSVEKKLKTEYKNDPNKEIIIGAKDKKKLVEAGKAFCQVLLDWEKHYEKGNNKTCRTIRDKIRGDACHVYVRAPFMYVYMFDRLLGKNMFGQIDEKELIKLMEKAWVELDKIKVAETFKFTRKRGEAIYARYMHAIFEKQIEVPQSETVQKQKKTKKRAVRKR